MANTYGKLYPTIRAKSRESFHFLQIVDVTLHGELIRGCSRWPQRTDH